jgi:predicted XRE-type DNA-binding protein
LEACAGGRNETEPTQFKEIRKLYRGGDISQERVARLCGITQAQVGNIVRGKCWRY